MKRRQRPPATMVFGIKNPIYPFLVVFIIGPRPELKFYRSIIRRFNVSRDWTAVPAVPETAACACAQFDNASVVWISGCDPTPKFFDNFNHELIHVLSNFQDVIGHRSQYRTDEPLAYYAGWLSAEFIRQVIRRRGRLDSRK